ncbi:small acid-soluble spore protein P [Pseudogracilibacillus sp. SO30301A]|uniref:small acid-soluble spore protein P n=1 Tax=Pseudogracilibacillus sp. SO30301A TaxID=3098291 RepID=UPI00300E6AFA
MSRKPKGPKQKDKPDLPKSPKQPYGEPLSGSHQHKMSTQGRERNAADNGM